MVATIHKWKGYLLNKHLIIKTDHQTLKYMLEQKESNPTLQKWLSNLLKLQYTMSYQKGSDNVVVDALSRKLEEETSAQCLALFDVNMGWKKRVQDSAMIDGKLQELIDVLKHHPTMSSKYRFSNGIISRNGKKVVCNDLKLQLELCWYANIDVLTLPG